MFDDNTGAFTSGGTARSDAVPASEGATSWTATTLRQLRNRSTTRFSRSSWTLVYHNQKEEEAFRRYLAPKASLYPLFMYAIGIVIVLRTPEDAAVELYLLFSGTCIVLFVVQVGILFAQWRSIRAKQTKEQADHPALASPADLNVSDASKNNAEASVNDALDVFVTVERIGFHLVLMVGLFTTIVVQYVNISEGECTFTMAAKGKAYQRENCVRTLPVGTVGGVCLTVLLQVIRFRSVVCFSAWATFLTVIAWLPLDVPLDLIVISVIFVVAGCTFLCAVRYDHERAQQQNFESHTRLASQLALLRTRRTALHEFCSGLIPEPLIMRSQANQGSQQEISTGNTDAVFHNHRKQVGFDHNDDVSFGIVRVDPSIRTSGRMLDIDIAVAISQFQDECAWIALKLKLDRVMSLGDQFAVVGNLIMPNSEAPVAMVAFMQACLDAANNGTERREAIRHLPVCAAFHHGPVTGRFVGENWVRYDVFGPTVNACQRLLLHANPGAALTSKVAQEAFQNVEQSTREEKLLSSMFSFEPLDRDVQKDVLETTGISNCATLKLQQEDGHAILGNSSSKDLEVSHNSGSQQRGRQSTASSFAGEPQTASSLAVGQMADDILHLQGVKRALHSATSQGEREEPSMRATAEVSDSTQRNMREVSGSGRTEKDLVSLDSTILPRCFGLSAVFADPQAEQLYVRYRAREYARRAVFVWLAYALFCTVLLAIAISEPDGPLGPYGIICMIMGVLVSLLVSGAPNSGVVSSRLKGIRIAWMLMGVLAPLLMMYGCALMRPNIVGNDIRHMFLLAALLRSYSLPSIGWQAVLTPLLLVLSSIQYALPGAAMRFVPTYYLLVGWGLYIDADRDIWDRRNFAALAGLQRLVPALAEEQRLRLGLLKSTLPDVVYEEYAPTGIPVDTDAPTMRIDSMLGSEAARSAHARSLNDTTVIVVKALPNQSITNAMKGLGSSSPFNPLVAPTLPGAAWSSGGAPSAVMDGNSFRIVEEAARMCPALSIVGVAGDVALLVGPLFLQRELVANTHRREHVLTEAVLALASAAGHNKAGRGANNRLSESSSRVSSTGESNHSNNNVAKYNTGSSSGGGGPPLSVLVDFDATVQLLRLGEYPRFSVSGVAVQRLLTLSKSVDTPPGIMVSDKVARTLQSGAESTRFAVSPLEEAWAVRGIGLVRFNRLEALGMAGSTPANPLLLGLSSSAIGIGGHSVHFSESNSIEGSTT